MALTPTEEAQIRQLIAENPALLSLAAVESTILSKLGATKVNLSDLTAATSLSAADIALVRQGLNDKSFAMSVLLDYVTTNFPSASTTTQGKVELATNTETQTGTDATRAVTPAGLASLIATLDVGIQAWDSGEAYISPVLVYGSDDRLYISQQDSTNQDPTSDDGTNWRVLDNSFGYSFLHVQDQKASGTDGGTFTSGSYQVRDLNTVVSNGIPGASLTSNRITLPVGVYIYEISACGFRVDRHKAHLYDVTGAGFIGEPAHVVVASNGQSIGSISLGRGVFTLSTLSEIELQHRCQTTRATDGYGSAAGFGDAEVYSDVKLWKII